MTKVAINACFGGFGLSTKAYERLIELGVPCRGFVEQKQDPETRLYLPEPLNDGEVIFDRRLAPDELAESMTRLSGTPYWDCWTKENRTHPLVIQVIEELGEVASGKLSKLKIVEIPDDVEWEIDEYDGMERVAEAHRTWA